ncbi:PIR protein [Plasmodium yoelii yoelii]|uniref:PIR protein n=2 Tax=Plasmodium yoelii TaxID=5861 RepID=A0AAE9WPW2_PLAYO|nr:PIR protein [Plasmodium yoelii yoelii]
MSIKNSFPNYWGKTGDYKFIINGKILNGYCFGNNCDNDLEKINAGCLYLFDAFFENSDLFMSVANSNIDIVEYIIIWLSKVLNRIKNEHGNSLKFFYDIYIKNHDKYKNPIYGVENHYNSYKDLIDKKNMMNINIKEISKLYDAFTTLCMMYVEFNEKSSNCKKYLEEANKFVDQYKKLEGDSSITDKSSYTQLLFTLLNDYNNFINKCSGINCPNISSFPSIEKAENDIRSSEQIVQKLEHVSEDPSSSSSITSNLFIVLSIFGAIAFFFGISYKYSLFGFRKRFQKQKLREKIKNIKKRMNH